MLIETVYDINEFIRKIDDCDVHYEIDSGLIGPAGEIGYVKLILYGIRNLILVKCEMVARASWGSEEVRRYGRKNAMENLRLWMADKRKEMEAVAKELGATPGRYEIFRCFR